MRLLRSHVGMSMVLLCLAAVAATPCAAQSGPGLVMKPWMGEENVELNGSLIFGGRTSSQGFLDNVRIVYYESTGRVRVGGSGMAAATTEPGAGPGAPLATQEATGLSFGYDVNYVDIRTDDARLPEQLTDQSAAVGLKLGDFGGWRLDLVAGAGYAGNEPYGDCRAVYGKADLVASRMLDERSKLILILDYNGNRTLWPDVPLPGVAYQRQVSDTLSYTVGLPTSVYWQPHPLFTVNAAWLPPYDFDAEARFQFYPKWFTYAAYQSRYDAYTIAGQDEHRREFFGQNRLEAGVRFAPARMIEASFGVGIAMAQKFSTGWDSRETDTITKLSDRTYLRFQATVRF